MLKYNYIVSLDLKTKLKQTFYCLNIVLLAKLQYNNNIQIPITGYYTKLHIQVGSIKYERTQFNNVKPMRILLDN